MRIFAIAFALIISTSAFAQDQQSETAPAASTTPQSRGNAFNPDIGINGLFLYQNSNRGNDLLATDRNGFGIQEAELQFASDVDAYWRFVSTFSLHQEVEVDSSAVPPTRTSEFVFEPEEIYAESLNLPFVTLRLGKFKAAFGKHNLLHTHAFPFIDAPLANQVLLGDEGFNDTGVSASALIPTSWFSELTIQGFSGQGEGIEYFHGASPNDVVGLAHFKNLWDLNEDLTFEVGLSGANGKNAADRSTQLLGADVTFKWRGSRDKAVIWATEALSRELNAATDEKGRGIASWIQYQFSQRFWAQIRAEYLEMKDQDPASPELLPEFQRKQSALIGFVPSEFSAVRLQYDHLDDGAQDPEQKVMLQFNYSIGAHPAHAY